MRLNFEKLLMKLAKVSVTHLRIKRIVTYAADGKRYINIDCCFTKHIQIKEAHRIASQVEKETKERFANAVVTVHIEPRMLIMKKIIATIIMS